MTRKFFCKVAAVVLALTLIISTASAEGIWRLDGTNEYELPRNFRAMENLNISASGQPSLENLAYLAAYLKNKLAGDGRIFIVDLREESHGFFNGYPVSFYQEKNLANFFTPRDQIESIETELLNDMLGSQVDLIPLGNEDKKIFKPVNIFVSATETERAAAISQGLEYARFPTTDMYFPTPEVVDEFISFVVSRRKNDLLHFHCQAGHGRTTTFTVMYEILINPEKSLGEICSEQAAAGGSNLIERRIGDDYYTEAHNLRAEQLIKFFNYVRGVQREEIGLSWSEYLDNQN